MKSIKVLIFLMLSCGLHSYAQDKNVETISERLDDYLSGCASNGFSGAVLVSKDDKLVFSQGYGFADKDNEMLNSPDIIVDVSSVTKQFTAAAILKLNEKGLLQLTNPISMYFKDLPIDKQGITVHHLLTHSSGLTFGIGDGDFDHIPMDTYFQNLFDTDLLHAPGSKYEYSNAGYSVLGRIIELVSGKNYENFLAEELFEAAGMKDTGYLLPDWDMGRVAKEYYLNVINKGSQIEKYQEDGKIAWPLKANGGINSTLEDMYKWYLALSQNKVLGGSSIDQLTSSYIKEYEDGDSYYGYGWAIFPSERGSKVVTHNGYNGKSYFELIWIPEEDVFIAMYTNAFVNSSFDIIWNVEKIIRNKSYKAKPIQKDVRSEVLEFTERSFKSNEAFNRELEAKFSSKVSSVYSLDRLVYSYKRAKAFDKALSLAQSNANLYPNEWRVWNTLANIYVETNQKKEAIQYFKKALAFRPEEEETCIWCAEALDQINRLEE